MRFPRIRYSGRQLMGDAAGGVIAALIALPYGLALATMMGLPPVLGLFSSLLTAPLLTLLGRNPMLIGGTASATVPFIAGMVGQQGPGGAAKVCLVASVCLMAFCVLRLGRYIAHVPGAVVSGFSCGIGAMMVITQLRTIFGLNIRVDYSSSNTLYQLVQVTDQIGDTRLAPLVLGVLVIVLAFAAHRWSSRLPAPMLGLLGAVAASVLFGFHEREVGRLPMDLPPFAGFVWKPSDVWTVLPTGFGLAVISAVNILITSRVVEHFRGKHKHLKRADADAELGAYGIANLCAAMVAAPLSLGIPARSLASIRCGGTTRLANLFHAAFLLGFLLVGADLIAHIPLAALAGVTAYVGLCLLEWSTWHRLRRMRRVDAAAFLVTTVATLTVNAVAAVAIGCSLYAVRALYVRMAGTMDTPLPQLQAVGPVERAD